jgi:hypothetical protein
MEPTNADSDTKARSLDRTDCAGAFRRRDMAFVIARRSSARHSEALPSLVNPVQSVCGRRPYRARKRFRKLAGSMIIPPLSGLVIGAYAHLLSPGTDSIFRMPSGAWDSLFRSVLCCWRFWRRLAVGLGFAYSGICRRNLR